MASADALRSLRLWLASAIFMAIMVSFKPLSGSDFAVSATSASGDIVNQLGFGSLGLLSIGCLLCFIDRRVLYVLADAYWLALLAFVAVSLIVFKGPDAAVRVFVFTAFALTGILAVLALPKDFDSFLTVIATGAIAVLVLSYVGLIIKPYAAIHQAAGAEAIHAGLWRGIYQHKNIAGPVMASFAFAGILLVRADRKRLGWAIIVAATLFVMNTGSKTSAGLVPLAALMVLLPGIFGLRLLAPLFFATTLALFGIFTIGFVLFEPIREFVLAIAPGTTYTGRTSLWAFAVEKISAAPLFGYGLESFWETAVAKGAENPFDLAWDVRLSVHAHNGYLDLALALGLPGTVFFLVTMILRPMADYLGTGQDKHSVLLADFFLMVLIFTALNACLESFFLRRADPVWMCFFLAVAGLRLTAKLPRLQRSQGSLLGSRQPS
jgi:O-antigen ligase